jgi:hypothetical protein
MDQDAIVAAADLVGRTGARELQVGYLHDGVPAEDAAWYAHAQYRGARIIEENHRGPGEALDALARRLLGGARCRCGALVALSDRGAVAFPGRMADGSTWGEGAIRAAGQCRWTLVGSRWEPSCPEPVDRVEVDR